MPTLSFANQTGAMAGLDSLHLEHLLGVEIQQATPGALVISNSPAASVTPGNVTLIAYGQNLVYDANDQLVGGTITSLQYRDGPVYLNAESIAVPAAQAYGWVTSGDNAAAISALLANGAQINAYLFSNDHLVGGGAGDTINGSGGNDILEGGAGHDTLIGGETNGSAVFRIAGGPAEATFVGGAGNDTIYGSSEHWNTAVFSGARADYSVTRAAGDFVTVTDLRPGVPDGIDNLHNVTELRFSDGSEYLGMTNNGQARDMAVRAILRDWDIGHHLPQTLQLTLYLPGDASLTQIVDKAVKLAADTTSVATMSYQFFTGHMPTEAGLDYLVSPQGPNLNSLNSYYYQAFSLENRYINFAVNLGKAGEGRAAFQAEYGSLDLFTATKTAYAEIFGAAPTDAKVHALLDPTATLGGVTMTRAQYFAGYGQDGPDGLGTKAAMVGWLLAEAAKADIGMYAKANDAFLSAALLDHAPFGVDLIGHYGQDAYVYTGG
jgi:Ca2+-binding RTX toxin-like protein